MVVEFKARRDLIVDGLNAIPGHRVPQAGRGVLRLPRHLRDRASPAPSWPSACSRRPACASCRAPRSGCIGDHHIRISYANSQANLLEALGRIRALVEPLVAARV